MRVPWLPAKLLSSLLPDAERREVLDELADEFEERAARESPRRARLWYWRQTFGSLPHFVRRSWWRGRTGFEPHANAFRDGGPSFEQWVIDSRQALRRLVRRPRYAALAILTLSLGIGGTAAVFGIARGVFLAPLPYSAPASLALFWSSGNWTQEEFAYLRGRIPGFSGVAQYRLADQTLETDQGPTQLIPGMLASSELFAVLGTRPALGRTFNERDDVRGAEPVVVISFGLWQELGGTASVIGRRVRLSGTPTTIVGVMPQGFFFPTPTVRAWLPQPLDANEQVGNFSLVGRVGRGWTTDRMAPALAQLTRLLRQRFTYTAQWDKTREPSVMSVRESIAGPLRPTLAAIALAMTMILLIACANVASLMLGQVEGRSTELALRASLGATRTRLTRQLAAEAAVLGVVAGLVGAGLAAGGFRWLLQAIPLGAWGEAARLDWSVFAVAMAVAIVAALTISLAPTLSLWHGRLRATLGAERTSGVAGRGVRLESALVVTEVAIAVLMAAGAGLLVRSVQKLHAIDPGLRDQGVGVVSVVLPSDLNGDQRKRLIGDLLASVRSVPAVRSAAVTQKLPLLGPGWSSGVTVDGIASPATAFIRAVSDDYFETLGIRVDAGRSIDRSDLAFASGDSAGGVIVVSEAFKSKYFRAVNPLGHRVDHGLGRGAFRVVGVVHDVAEGSLTDAPQPTRYVPYPLVPFMIPSQTIVFRGLPGQNLVSLLEEVRATIRASAPRVAIRETTTMERVVRQALGPARDLLALVVALTALALVLGAIGIYGVMSHFVARRKRDWAIRIALGLSPGRVVTRVVQLSTALVMAGIAAGLIAFALTARFMTALIYGIGAVDPVAMISATLGLLLVGVLGAMLPAWRASKADPATVLRES